MTNTAKLLTIALLFASMNVWAQKEYQLASPDGKLKATIRLGDRITYNLTHESADVLSDSPVSMTLETGETLGKAPKGVKAKQSSVNRTVASPFYKKSRVEEKYNELALTFAGNYGIIFRAYDEGFAYRFTTSYEGEIVVTAEEFTLNFPKDYKTFAAYSTTGGPFEAQFHNSFEGPYVYEPLSKLNPEKIFYLPALVDLEDGKKLCITEVDLYGFPGAWLNGNGSQSLQVVHAGYPKKTEPRGSSYVVLEKENYIAKSSGTRAFPWRLLIVAKNDGALLACDMVYSIAEACRIADTSWIKPGKVIWDWWHATALTGVDFRSGMNTETFKYYVDFAAKYGLEYVLVDAGWAIDADNILAGVRRGMDFAELVKYGRSKNVDILCWMSYRAFHHDMENVARYYADLGVKGFKIDFQDRDDQQIEDFVYAAAETCAKYKLLIDFHGIHKPTGLQRTWPNVINYEGVMGLEWVKFGDQQTLDLVTNDVTIPFIRMIAGPFDYTPGAMLNANKQNFRVVNSEPMSQGTRCRQLAAYIVFDAPLTMLSDRPSNYEKEQECIHFMSKIPTVWEQTLPLENKVSEFVSLARKTANDWYIGGMTNWNERELTLDLSFLDDGNYKAELFTDGVNANRIASDYKKELINIPANRKLTIKMAQGGGFAARIYK
jgi:alpha-glucosidase